MNAPGIAVWAWRSTTGAADANAANAANANANAADANAADNDPPTRM